MASYNKTRNAIYNLKYEVAWCVKWRRNLLKPPIDRTMKTILRRICRERDYRIEQLQVVPDYIHFLISVPPRVAPAEVVKHLKGVSARKLLDEYPELRKKLTQGRLWTSTYYIATVGTDSEDAVQRYVESQRKKR
ncbi:IS200/IS605 family transposase [Candidatus Poribacteria bacterium]|nr:IS200/IS605 family transposase [Candidatus Poribacteria bacterium]